MIEPVPPEVNLRNLHDIFEHIQHLEAFIFFGTLLGFTRERRIIPHDDDIDIYVNRTQIQSLITSLADTDFDLEEKPQRRIHQPWRRTLVIQATREVDGHKSFADFYLYDASPKDHLVERWNFEGNWRDRSTDIHVPKSLIFPLRFEEMQGSRVTVPAEPEMVCEFLYGPTWQTPVKKDSGYTMKIENHVPRFVPKV